MEILLKSSALIAIFYLFYQILLSKETFHQFNRVFLILGIILAFSTPFIIFHINRVPVFSDIIQDGEILKIIIDKNENSFLRSSIPQTHNYNFYFLQIIYFLGVFIMLIRFIFSLKTVLKTLLNSSKTLVDGYNLIETDEDITPFSFFKNIIINPSKYTQEELHDILKHETTHVKQWHTIDIILGNILCIVLWFNPFSYLYKKIIEQNLEYIADSSVVQTENSSNYEFLLLRTIVPQFRLQLVNNFFSSPIKKRIAMINSNPSTTVKKLKYLFLIPILSLFLYAFNTEEVFVFDKYQIDSVSFVHPVKNYKKISSVFGERVHPVFKVKKFHTGIDYLPGKNPEVIASAPGKVISTGYNKDDGNYVIISHSNGYETQYKHLLKSLVSKGQSVEQNQVIGIIGNSGKSIGIHLHFEILKNGKFIDPETLLPKKYSSIQNILNRLINKKYIRVKTMSETGEDVIKICALTITNSDKFPELDTLNNLSDFDNDKLDVINFNNDTTSKLFLLFKEDDYDKPAILINTNN